MILELIAFAVVGLIVGALGRLALPGRDPMGLGMTALVGMGSALTAGVIGKLLFGRPGGFLLSVLVALGAVYLIRKSRERSVGGPAADTRL
jgi:uncharacterized membrane protein YeaQ/YmgE (transglycosylase-associated protein family)